MRERASSRRCVACAGAFSLVFALLVPSGARANPWDIYGFNARALGMGNAETAMARDFTAVYYNPAALTISSEAGFGLGLTLCRPDLELAFDKSPRSIREVEAPGSDAVTFGASFPLSGSLAKDRVVLGFGMSVPTGSLIDGQALDPAIPQWYLYHALPRRMVVAAGLGVAPFDWISIGLSFQFLAGLTGRIDYELDVVAGRYTKKTVTFEITPKAAPIVGLEVRPTRDVRLGFSYRDGIRTNVDLPARFELTDLADLAVETMFDVQYTPTTYSVGASYDVEPLALELGADLTYALWEEAPDPSVQSSIDFGGELLDGAGLDGALDAPALGQERRVDLGFRNIFIPRIGAEKRFGMFRLRAGWELRPSPAPVQTSGSNYVDGTAHRFSIGGGLRFRDPIGLFANMLAFDVGSSIFWLPPRRHEKISSTDPVGSYEASGSIVVLGVALSYAFSEAKASASTPTAAHASDGGASDLAPAPPPTPDAMD